MTETVPFPPVNVPEKIVLCLDLTEDEDIRKIGLGEYVQPLDKVIKTALAQFINLKSSFNVDTEFALVGMKNQKSKWIETFTTDSNIIIDHISHLQIFPSKQVEFNMADSLFPILEENLRKHLPSYKISGDAPSYVCRIILIYKSSYTVPQLENFNFSMFDNPYLFFDVFYLHSISTKDNNVEKIFKNLCEVNRFGTSYVLELLNTQILRIFNSMSLLLAHPLQRTPLKYFNTDIKSILAENDTDQSNEEIGRE